jgi:hypothetical protein
MTTDDSDAWKENAQNGWAALREGADSAGAARLAAGRSGDIPARPRAAGDDPKPGGGERPLGIPNIRDRGALNKGG